MIAAVTLKVVAYGVVPFVMAWIGNHLAAVEIQESKRRRMYRIAFSLLAVVGMGIALTVEIQAYRAHKGETDVQRRDIETLRSDLQRAETARQLDNAVLKTKLEDAYQMNAQLGRFAPAIMKLAQASAEFTRKQYAAKVTSEKDLYTFTMGVVKNIREFSRKYEALSRQQTEELMNSMRQPRLTEAEKQQRWNQSTQKWVQVYFDKIDEFRTSVLPDALYARQELLRRTIPEPVLSPMQKSEVDIVMRGVLAGPYPELALADYLEQMANQLSQK
jgi:hypothetical protein